MRKNKPPHTRPVTEKQGSPTTAKGAILRTVVLLGIAVAIFWGFLGGSWFTGSGGKKLDEKTRQNWLAVGGNPRALELSEQHKEILFAELSDYLYYTPQPGEKPDPKQLKDNKIPDDIKRLDGQKISLSGFMLPLDSEDNQVKSFILNGNYDMCYFGAPVSLNEWALVKLKPGKSVPYTHLPITVFGQISVGEEIKDGQVESIYRIQASAIATPKEVYE